MLLMSLKKNIETFRALWYAKCTKESDWFECAKVGFADPVFSAKTG